MSTDRDRVDAAWEAYAEATEMHARSERHAYYAGWKAAADALTPQERTVQAMSPMEKEKVSREALLADLRARRADTHAPPADTGDGGAARDLDAEVERLTRERDEAHEAAGDYASHLERAERERDEAAEARLALAREAIGEAIQQIEYLHEKFRETGSGNGVLARLRAALTDCEPAGCADREASRP